MSSECSDIVYRLRSTKAENVTVQLLHEAAVHVAGLRRTVEQLQGDLAECRELIRKIREQVQ